MFSLKDFLLGTAYITVANTVIWFATNGQFFNKWISDNKHLTALIAGPIITFMCIISTKHYYKAFDELIWPGRMISFASGTVVMAVFAYCIMNEPMNFKTMVSLMLCILILIVQVWL